MFQAAADVPATPHHGCYTFRFFGTERLRGRIQILSGRGFSLTAIHLISPEEIDPQTHLENTLAGGDWLVEDAETGETKAVTINAETLAQYQAQQQTFCETLRRFCIDQGINYAQLKSDTPIESFILRELHRAGVIQRNQ